jgi:hypothetical protein
MFATPMLEAANGRVYISDLDSKTLELMLEWMYAAKAPDLGGDDGELLASGLLLAADKYQLDELKVSLLFSPFFVVVVVFLVSIQTPQYYCELAFPEPRVETVCDELALAQLHGAQLLKTRATLFLKAHAVDVVRTEGWRKLLQGNPSLVSALFAAVATM